MTRRPFSIRTVLVSAAIAGAFALAGCETDGTPTLIGGKDMKPLSDSMAAEIESKSMDKTSPILVRLFKQEAELEVWKEDRSGRFALLKTYPICRWSGELGPKVKEGDRQAPEGFYSITPAQMNPNSAYYLSFNMGYPNAFDKAWDRTGSQLMVHGDCSSRGCYAMTDEQIGEIYALGRESFFGGQRAFQVQAYPFRMTSANMAKHRNNPNMPFWRMIKQGYDHFEVSRQEPKVDVCERRYVFNAQQPANASRPLTFNGKAKCPVFEIPAEIAEAVHEKQRKDEFEIAELTRRNVPVAPIKTGTDGGMNPVFLAALNKTQEVRDPDGSTRFITTSLASVPGTVPATVNPPRQPQPEFAPGTGPMTVGNMTVASVPLPRAAPLRKDGAAPASEPSFTSRLGSLFSTGSTEPKPAPTRVAAVEPAPQAAEASGRYTTVYSSRAEKSESFTDKIGRWFRGGSEPKPGAAVEPPPAPKPRPVALAKPASLPAPSPVPTAAPAGSAPPPVVSRPQPRPEATETQPENTVPRAALLSGAQPMLPASSFDSRFGALR